MLSANRRVPSLIGRGYGDICNILTYIFEKQMCFFFSITSSVFLEAYILRFMYAVSGLYRIYTREEYEDGQHDSYLTCVVFVCISLTVTIIPTCCIIIGDINNFVKRWRCFTSNTICLKKTKS